MKCMPMTFDGLLVVLPILVILILLVLLARIVCEGVMRSNSEKMSFFNLGLSLTAYI